MDSELRQCPTTGTPSSCAVSQTMRSSSSVQTLISGPLRVGISPVTWTLIQSTPYLICSAHLLDDLVAGAHDDRVAGAALVLDQAARGAPDRGHERVATRPHARADDEAGVDRVAQLHADVSHRQSASSTPVTPARKTFWAL